MAGRKRLLYTGTALAAVAAVAVIILGVVLAAGDGRTEGVGAARPTSTAQPPTATPTAPPGIAPGEPTPPPRGDTPVSNRDTPVPAPSVLPTEPGLRRVLAPIDGLEVMVLESAPPQYLARVTAGLPSGCAKADGYELTRTGSEVKIDVYNTLPTGPVACTQIYGTYVLNINLGSTFSQGQEYRVVVNDKVTTFRAQ
jgi:hypothetical protein